ETKESGDVDAAATPPRCVSPRSPTHQQNLLETPVPSPGGLGTFPPPNHAGKTPLTEWLIPYSIPTGQSARPICTPPLRGWSHATSMRCPLNSRSLQPGLVG